MDLGCLTYFLGLKVNAFDKGIVLNQLKDLIDMANLHNCKLVDTLIELGAEQQNDGYPQFGYDSSLEYQLLVPSLIYPTMTAT